VSDRPGRSEQAQFSQPVRQIMQMLVVSVLVAAGAWLVYPSVSSVFLANLWLNGAIGVVFVAGLLACFWQVVQLVVSVGWIENFVGQKPGHDLAVAPRLLAPLAALLRTRRARMQISASSARSILDSVATRIDEARDITRYIVNLLIYLGLLGTFYGLATTVPALVDTIRALAPEPGESGVQVFEKLMGGLESQLGGMGTAFSSSLLGLAGSLVVGLLELFAGHGQNRFYRELEEWLSGITRIGYGGGEGEGPADAGALGGLLEAMTQRLDALQRREDELADALSEIGHAVERIGVLGDGVQAQADALDRLAVQQARSAGAIEALLSEMRVDGLESDSRMRLRSIDMILWRIHEELAAGRAEGMQGVRDDLARLIEVIRRATEPEA
jgi:hypothetical protein